MNRFLLSTSLLISALSITGAMGQTWTRLKNVISVGAYNPTMLFDGSVLIQDGDGNGWFRLTPDATGSYINGTWTTLPNTGSYAPLYYSSQVLPDGRVFILGGEYNGTNSPVWTNQGEIFDPSVNKFTPLLPPTGWNMIGDMGSVMLPNGMVLVQDPFGNNGALFNWTTNTFTSPFGSGKGDNNDEEGLTLLPNGKVFTIDVVTSLGAELFDPVTATWSKAANTPVNLVDTADEEIGAQIVRPDGTVMCFGGNGANAIYHPSTNTWSTAPSFPTTSAGQLDCADAPACLLPSGNILVETAPGFGGVGCTFFEFNGTSFLPAPGVPNSPFTAGFAGNMLTLPTGQILFTDQTNDIEVFTPDGAPNPAWAPTIVNCPSQVKVGSKNTLTGTQLTGLSGGSGYGDDEQNQTNFPLFRITNKATGHVFYCPQSGLSTRAIATGSLLESAQFSVPSSIELGPSTIQVVTNGIPSIPRTISVGPPVQASAVSVFEGTKPGVGTKTDVNFLDGLTYSTTSLLNPAGQGQVASVEVDYVFPPGTINGLTIGVSATAKLGVTEQIYAWNFKTRAFVLLGASAFGSGLTTTNTTVTTNGSQFMDASGNVRVLVRGVLPPHVSTSTYKLSVDVVNVTLR